MDLTRISDLIRRSDAEVSLDLDDDTLEIYGGCDVCERDDIPETDVCCDEHWLTVNAEGDVFFGDELPEDAMTLLPLLEAIRAAKKNAS